MRHVGLFPLTIPGVQYSYRTSDLHRLDRADNDEQRHVHNRNAPRTDSLRA